ncbi:beta-1,4-glucuronyltransferase 1-like [Haematobia irritans]|uniref:beta-1,4-glucuronyltransferase 1-like n=1 Tax=Haematobia irritans TaxID=7368 RepID=UPI003F50ACB5
MIRHYSCVYRKGFGFALLLCFILIAFEIHQNIRNGLVVAEMKPDVPLDYRQQIRTKQLKSMLNCYDIPLSMERLQYGRYWLVRNLIRGRLSIDVGCAESITYTTNGDYTFMGNLASVVTSWMGPISFALFAPGYDFNATMDAIQYARNCLPESDLIRDYVSFHIYFPNDHMPEQRIPLTEEEANEWFYDCDLMEAPYENVNRSVMYKTQKNLTYPINVGRNIARKASNTYFIFACDIELNPSLGLIDKFLDMIVNNISLAIPDEMEKSLRVFALPVFEVVSNATIPQTKEELLPMLKAKKAILFHSRICKNCHAVPKYKEWLEANSTDELEISAVAKRQGSFAHWEPFYISNNKEPIFDERVTWEGQSNKRIQNYAMCLLNYDYYVLHPGFLVHSPGIKKFDPKSKRLEYVKPMNVLIRKKIIPEYEVLYGRNKKCKI